MKVTRLTTKNEIKKENIDSKYEHLIDIENLTETITRFTIAHELSTPDEYGGILKNETYIAIANMLKLQYKLPMRYLMPVSNACSYVAQKSQIFGEEKNIENAPVTIEPSHPNVWQLISYTPINQFIPLGTIFTINFSIPYTSDDGTEPKRKYLLSEELKTQSNLKDLITKESNNKAKYYGICNRKIPYCEVDIGSKIEAKFIVETSDLYESMCLFRFRRPMDNIIEFVTYDHMNVDIEYILNLMLENIDKKINDTEVNKRNLKEFIKILLNTK